MVKKILNIGKCNLQFFSKNIHFRIGCKGDLVKDYKNKFQIDNIFPFRKAPLNDLVDAI